MSTATTRGFLLASACLGWLGLCCVNGRASAQALPSNEMPEVQLERPAPDQGYYFTLGVHGTVAGFRESGDWLSSFSGHALSFRIGQAVTSYFDLGIRVDYASIGGQQRTGGLGSFGLDAGLRLPGPVGPWLLRAGIGLGGSSLSAPPDSDEDVDNFGAVAALEVGWLLSPFYDAAGGDSGGFSFVPLARLFTIDVGTRNAGYFAMLGLEISWWTGLPDNQLDLTLEEAFPSPQDGPRPVAPSQR